VQAKCLEIRLGVTWRNRAWQAKGIALIRRNRNYLIAYDRYVTEKTAWKRYESSNSDEMVYDANATLMSTNNIQ
jgi:hypothetical protein